MPPPTVPLTINVTQACQKIATQLHNGIAFNVSRTRKEAWPIKTPILQKNTGAFKKVLSSGKRIQSYFDTRAAIFRSACDRDSGARGGKSKSHTTRGVR